MIAASGVEAVIGKPSAINSLVNNRSSIVASGKATTFLIYHSVNIIVRDPLGL